MQRRWVTIWSWFRLSRSHCLWVGLWSCSWFGLPRVMVLDLFTNECKSPSLICLTRLLLGGISSWYLCTGEYLRSSCLSSSEGSDTSSSRIFWPSRMEDKDESRSFSMFSFKVSPMSIKAMVWMHGRWEACSRWLILLAPFAHVSSYSCDPSLIRQDMLLLSIAFSSSSISLAVLVYRVRF